MLIQHRQSSHRPSARSPDNRRHAQAQYTGWEEDEKPQVAPPPEINPRKTASKKKGKERTITANSKATLEDELLGLVEGEDTPGASASITGVKASSTAGGGGIGASSPHPYSDEDDDDDDDDDETASNLADRFDPDAIVQPSGLTRQQIITKVKRGDMHGLTEADVKAVQDEMWLRDKAGTAAPTNKDGTVRRKPGPAKGWKKLRGKDYDETRSEGGTSVGDGTMNGEAEAEIAALLGDEDGEGGGGPSAPTVSANGGEKKKRSRPSAVGKKRKVEEILDDTKNPEGSEFDSEDERMMLGDGGAPSGSRGGRIKEPGVGKGRWTRPIRPADSKGDADEIDPDQSMSFESKEESQAPAPLQPKTITIPPNTYDPRGVSEVEARHRLTLVEDLEKMMWAAICRDVPRVSRTTGYHPSPPSSSY